jgi:hypothetical protein
LTALGDHHPLEAWAWIWSAASPPSNWHGSGQDFYYTARTSGHRHMLHSSTLAEPTLGRGMTLRRGLAAAERSELGIGAAQSRHAYIRRYSLDGLLRRSGPRTGLRLRGPALLLRGDSSPPSPWSESPLHGRGPPYLRGPSPLTARRGQSPLPFVGRAPSSTWAEPLSSWALPPLSSWATVPLSSWATAPYSRGQGPLLRGLCPPSSAGRPPGGPSLLPGPRGPSPSPAWGGHPSSRTSRPRRSLLPLVSRTARSQGWCVRSPLPVARGAVWR